VEKCEKKWLQETAFFITLMYMNKKVVGVIVGIAAVLTLPFGLSGILLEKDAGAASVSNLLIANIDEVLSLGVTDCTGANNRIVSLSPSAMTGLPFASCYMTFITGTNNPNGFSLRIASLDGAQTGIPDASNWNGWTNDGTSIPYGDGNAPVGCDATHMCLKQVLAENTPPALPTLGGYYIAPTGNKTIDTTIGVLSNTNGSTWGFAVPTGTNGGNNNTAGLAISKFDAAYTAYPSGNAVASGKYAELPVGSGVVVKNLATTASGDKTQVFFGVMMSPLQAPGTYRGSILATVSAEVLPNPNPVVVAVYPDNGPLAGGTQVDIYGAYFKTGATQVTIGGVACTSVVVVSANHLKCNLPVNQTAGGKAVVVTTACNTAAYNCVSNNNVLYTYTTTPTPPGPNPYEPSGSGGVQGSSGVVPVQFGDESTTPTAPQGRSVFENIAEAAGDPDYTNMWLALGGGALLAGLIILLALLLFRKWDIYIMKELGNSRVAVIEILVEKVGLDAKQAVASLQKLPSLVVEKVSKRDAKKIVKLLEAAIEGSDNEVQLVRHNIKPDSE